jgi:hypothetical protein
MSINPASAPAISPWARGAAADPKQWFQKGYDPRRKPRGPNKIPEQFFKDMLAVWEQHGEECLRRAIVLDPIGFMRIAAKLMPGEIDLKALESEVALDTNDEALAILLSALSLPDRNSNRSDGATR